MSLPLICPTCKQSLHQHPASKGLYCDAKHHFDVNAQGYYPIVKVKAKSPQSSMTRQQMRARQFLLQSGLFQPLVACLQQTVSEVLNSASAQVNWLDYQCMDGFYLTKVEQFITQNSPELNITAYGVSDAENALFAASKASVPATLIFSTMKMLPFADESMDVVTIFDAPLKGQECIRVLKPDGRIVLIQPTHQHLWQIKQQVYGELAEKSAQLNIPKRLVVESEQTVSFTTDVTGDQALSLLDSAIFAWRANDEVRHNVRSNAISALKCEFTVLVLKQA
ncbi:putative RNA methyltransferase [Shewanella gaetbuli]|uniref:Methyltransferase domain-containing protein n=1 Tax=Shewanella gaetbuli TaxID=220752 RepID=A0A9X1ZLA4_9GAMM|nr:methyltransferase domain-containing protein [Shewanella gaetbuli]MCL1141945.1 methyltransferase domain-containing protein [Shewanella gaetbuli]